MTPTERDLHWMRLALEEARRAAERGEVPVGAVVVRGGELLASDANRCEERGDPTAHAELVAVRTALAVEAFPRLCGATVYCTLEPCCMCAGGLVLARVERVVFGARDPKFGGVRSLAQICDDPRANHRIAIEEGVLADASADLLRAFFRARRGDDRTELGRPGGSPERAPIDDL